jgi:hypothetical protein
MSSKQNASTADKFSSLFDENWKEKSSGIRYRRSTTIGYDPTYSWEGRTEGPKTFSKLNVTHVPMQNGQPIALSGTSVLPLEKSVNVSALSVRQDPTNGAKSIPLTALQCDLGMDPDLAGRIPVRALTQEKGSHVVMQDFQQFRNMQLQKEGLTVVKEPSFMHAAGEQADGCLLNPRQRRELLDFEKRKLTAEKNMKLAISDRIKTRKQITGPNFYRGILMVESSENEDSEAFGKLARSRHQLQEDKEQILMERRSYLASKQSSIATNGNILVPETIPSRVTTTRDFQCKGGINHALSVSAAFK